MIAPVRFPFLAAAMAIGQLPALPALAQAAPTGEQEAPPTTLPFSPTVPSAPPERPTYPQARQPAPPADPLCTEIGQIIRAGVVASRFASLSAGTEQGSVIGTYPAGNALQSLGADYCTVVVPAADPATASSAYNQVTCQLGLAHSEVPYLNDYRDQRSEIAARLGECPAMAQWTASDSGASPLGAGAVDESLVFSHPDVAVEIVLRATHRQRVGEWPMDYMRSLSLIFRTPNPDRPADGTAPTAAGPQP